MRTRLSIAVGCVVVLLACGCSGPEKKLGRGLNNVTEFARMGEIRRSFEQTALWDGPAAAYTTGVIRGFNRSVVRTAVGLYEVATFPIPSYDPVLKPNNPIYPDMTVDPAFPDSDVPRLIADPTVGPDSATGYAGGDVFPFVPGSRFRIFDY
ncbi:MAG: exosortase system-associated protein, TIGR04073 family [Verrucomicrobia bacterium]|nr:exosortase system-associated protein, TIGR04073 family [Verrucomicrobiota bacterium]